MYLNALFSACGFQEYALFKINVFICFPCLLYFIVCSIVEMIWVLRPRCTDEYRKGVQDFVSNGFANFGVGAELKCSCLNCANLFGTR